MKNLLKIIVFALICLSTFYTISCSNNNPDKKPDMEKLNSVSESLFKLHDKGSIAIGEIIIIYEEQGKKIPSIDYDHEKLIELDNKLDKVNFEEDIRTLCEKSGVGSIEIVDKDVIFFTTDSVFQSISGIAIIRNKAKLKDTYECTGYDTGTLSYQQIGPNVFLYDAGL